MEDKNIHKPLSAQELFNLIENKSEQKNNAHDLDDFEKEALEGFEEYSTPINAKKINQEIDSAISKKIAEHGSSTKNKVIWFSAAASIILLIVISIFYFNDSNINSDSNIALSESSVKEIVPLETNTPTEELKNEMATGMNSASTLIAQEIKPSQRSQEKNKPDESEITTSDSKDAISNNQLDEINSVKATDDNDTRPATKTLNDNITNTAPLEFAKNKKESVLGKVNAEREESRSYAGAIVKDQTKMDNAKDGESDKLMSEKKSTNSASAPSISQAEYNLEGIASNTRAYYNGEETALKNYIISISKKDNSNFVLKGKYKINVVVNTNGSIKVNSVINVTKDCNDCTKIITQILKDLKNWNPEIKNGKAIQSIKEFELEF